MRKPGFISLCILTTSMLFLLFTFPAKAKINVIASFSVIGDMAKHRSGPHRTAYYCRP